MLLLSSSLCFIIQYLFYILAILVKQRQYSVFFGMSIQKVRYKGTQAEEIERD